MVTKREAYAEGRANGYGIAVQNIDDALKAWAFGDDKESDSPFDAIVSMALETEAEHFRQFSPFEFWAAKLNADEDRAEELWASYDAGVHRGATKAASDFVREHPEEITRARVMRATYDAACLCLGPDMDDKKMRELAVEAADNFNDEGK